MRRLKYQPFLDVDAIYLMSTPVKPVYSKDFDNKRTLEKNIYLL